MRSALAVLLLSVTMYGQRIELGDLIYRGSNPTEVKTTESDAEFINTLFRATVLLYSQDENGGMNMRCTATSIGTVPGGYRFATASHCACSDVEEDEYAKPNKDNFYITDDDPGAKQFLPAKLYGCGYQHESDDFAVFEVKTDKAFPVIPIGVDVENHSAEPIINIASPQGLGRQTLRGYISNPKLDRAIHQDDINWTGAMVLALPNTAGGSSGSAIACEKQHAICGFLVGTIENSIVAIPVSRFTKFYAEVKAGTYPYTKPEADQKRKKK